MRKIAGSGFGSISQRHRSADLVQDPDPHQNVMDPQHCFGLIYEFLVIWLFSFCQCPLFCLSASFLTAGLCPMRNFCHFIYSFFLPIPVLSFSSFSCPCLATFPRSWSHVPFFHDRHVQYSIRGLPMKIHQKIWQKFTIYILFRKSQCFL